MESLRLFQVETLTMIPLFDFRMMVHQWLKDSTVEVTHWDGSISQILVLILKVKPMLSLDLDLIILLQTVV